MLEDYLNQTCTVRYADGTNARGQPIYSEPHSVPCRLVQKHQLVNRSDGSTVTAEHICYLTEKITTGDTINGLAVLSVSEMTDLDGEITGYKAVM